MPKCKECGMMCETNELHPYTACVSFKAYGNPFEARRELVRKHPRQVAAHLPQHTLRPEYEPNGALCKAIARWFITGDVGTSSTALAAMTLRIWSHGEMVSDAPRDAGDFGRCARLIASVPEVRESVDLLSKYCGEWAVLAPVWDELTDEYWHGDKRALSNRIYSLLQSVHTV